ENPTPYAHIPLSHIQRIPLTLLPSNLASNLLSRIALHSANLNTAATGRKILLRQRRHDPPLRIRQHRLRLPRLINRQLARIMPTTTIMQERLTKNTALSETDMDVVVVHPLRRARRVGHAATSTPLTRTSRRIQQFGRLKLMHRVKERHHLRSRASRVREIHRTPKSMQRH